MRLVVVSTGKNPPTEARRLCLQTVRDQTLQGGAPIPRDFDRFLIEHGDYGPHEIGHIYFDAAEQDPPRTHWENLLTAITPLPPETVIVSLDGDDWLSTPRALEVVARAHTEGAWVTWGSFVFADGRPGFAADLPPHAWTEPPPYYLGRTKGRLRHLSWITTHLKTFRAGLFQRIDPEHFKFEGQWMEHARDLALMYPVLEMAGPDRSRFIAETLYVYNMHNATEFYMTPADRAEERRQVEYVRGLPPYARVEAL